MQFLIDTATDSPAELYKIGRFLVDQFETVLKAEGVTAADAERLGPAFVAKVTAPDAPEAPTIIAAPPPPPALPVGDIDPDVELDDAGSVTAVTVSTELPAAPPPPRPPSIAALVPAAAPGVEVDTTGVAWSAALHTSTKSKTIDGRWKPRKPRDPPAPPPAVVATMEAQNTPGNVPPPPPPPAVPPLPAVPSAAIGSAAPSTGIATTPLDFRGLMQKIQKATADGKLAAEQVNAALAGVGLKPEEMAQLINNAPLIASVNAAIDSCLS
jgi:hypothetical protein